MKKMILYFLFSISCSYSYADHFLIFSSIIPQDSITINQIIFSRGGNPASDSRQLTENSMFTILINQNGSVHLKWNGQCPKNKDNSIICSYSGIISKDQFNLLSQKLIEIKFRELDDRYITHMDDAGIDGYGIIYNNDKKKSIQDQNYEITGLKIFREMLIKLKNEIRWVPDN